MTGDIEAARLNAGRTPQGKPPLLNPGERYWRLRQTLCRGVWMFAGVP